MKKEKKFCRSQHTSLKKSSLSYSLCHQLSASESPVEIGPAVPEITRNKQRDRQKFKKMLFWHMYHVNIHMHLVKSAFIEVLSLRVTLVLECFGCRLPKNGIVGAS
ncbi:unnamed protein product [Arctia plantaginis]|uniref:Uncharacterized protein n=1 Tax=Arctia plantaginis TaxID=874455 RepID=A0A8S1AEN6_ARCPL|nr:unnamed protein product [Arctia plantaginis]